MAELWEIIFTIIGAGIVGYVIRWFEEKRRRTHEKEMEYRKELRQNLPDLIEPLFTILGDLWRKVILLVDWKKEGFNISGISWRQQSSIGDIDEALRKLKNFVEKNETKMELILPSLLFWKLFELLDFLRDHIVESKQPSFDDLMDGVGAINSIQSDIQQLLGFKMKGRFKSEYIFRKRPSRFERLKRKLRRS